MVSETKTRVWTFARCSAGLRRRDAPNRGKTGMEIRNGLPIKEE